LVVDPPSAPEPGAQPLARAGPGALRGRAHVRELRAPMSPDQDWCLQCGAGAPGSLSSVAGGRRMILIAAAVLALAAAGAAVARSANTPSPT